MDLKKILLLGLSALLIGSCSVVESDNDISIIPLTRAWELTGFFDENGNPIQLTDSEIHTLRFTQDRTFDGSTACNEYGGAYRAEVDGDITLKQVISTDELCPEPNQSEEYLRSLSKVQEFDLNNGRLVLQFEEKGRLVYLERLEN